MHADRAALSVAGLEWTGSAEATGVPPGSVWLQARLCPPDRLLHRV